MRQHKRRRAYVNAIFEINDDLELPSTKLPKNRMKIRNDFLIGNMDDMENYIVKPYENVMSEKDIKRVTYDLYNGI